MLKDLDIILSIRKDPDKGFRLLVQRYAEALYWHIRRLVVSHADTEDAVQETFVRIYKSFGKYEGGSLAAWIYRIATNEALRIRSRRKDASLDDDFDGQFDAMADEYVDYSDLEAVKLQKAILSLPTRQQLAFTLRYYDDLSYGEIARITDSTPDNVKANYHFAKEKIVKYMKSND